MTPFYIGRKTLPGPSVAMELSCLQIFGHYLTVAEVHHYKDCHALESTLNGASYIEDVCPENYDFYYGTCYKASVPLK